MEQQKPKDEQKKKIEELRKKLNDLLASGKTPQECLPVSQELDELINDYMEI